LQTIATNLVHARSAVNQDRRLVAADAVQAYVYGTPETGFASYFSTSATMNEARNQYTNQIVGNLTKDETSLLASETQLETQEVAQQAQASEAQSEAAQAKSLAQANEQEAATTKSTLNQIQGQLAQEVAAAAIQEAQQEAAAAAAARSAAAQQKATAAAATAATVAGAVGGSASAAAATTAANQAGGATGPVGGSSQGGSAGMAAVRAAVSQLGVPYVFGGEQAGVGFDCSGLVQWAWHQAGVSIPRTTETEWPALTHVSLAALQPGDLLFYYNLDADNQVDHVVMYAGSGPYGTDTVIQAPFTGSTVSYSPIFTTGLIGAARP
jgi:cell wall-associated NlpC family hydrolase